MRAPLLGLREAIYLLLFVFSFIWRMPNLKKFSKCLRKNGKVYHNGRRTKSRKPMICSKRTKVSTANLTQFILTFSHTNAICRGNNIISSAIWRKQAQVNFSKATKLHEPKGQVQCVVLEKFTSAYYTTLQEKSCDCLLIMYMENITES